MGVVVACEALREETQKCQLCHPNCRSKNGDMKAPDTTASFQRKGRVSTGAHDRGVTGYGIVLSMPWWNTKGEDVLSRRYLSQLSR